MLGSLVLAGIGCALMSNPGKKARRAKKRSNPVNGTHNLIRDFKEMPNKGYWLREIRAGRNREFLRAQHCPLDSRIVVTPGKEDSRVAVYHDTAKKRSNPKHRTTKKSKHRTSPGSAASRLAHWRWHHNPKPRNLEEHTFRRGATTIRIATWRNANSTAFIIVETGGPHGVKVWEAKSQGPSSGGFNKAHQAAERVYRAIAGSYSSLQGQELLEEIADAAAAKVASRSNPRKRRKARRK